MSASVDTDPGGVSSVVRNSERVLVRGSLFRQRRLANQIAPHRDFARVAVWSAYPSVERSFVTVSYDHRYLVVAGSPSI
jgi:hypothetical protein